jgi:hypothetical protein
MTRHVRLLAAVARRRADDGEAHRCLASGARIEHEVVSPHLVRSARRERSRGSWYRCRVQVRPDDSIEQSQSDDPIDPNIRTAVLTRRHG